MDGAAVDIRMKNDEKNKALEAAIGQIEKAFGKGSVMKLGQRESAVDVQAISTGSLGLDIGLGIGGFPKGRIIEIYGPNLREKQRLRFMRSLKHKRKVALAHLLMLSMLLIQSMPANSV